MKTNQGMQRPSLGGIGSRLDVGRTGQVCRHGREKLWRLRPGAKWICSVCHPPAVADYETWDDQ